MERCVSCSTDLYEKTPLSITFRQHALDPEPDSEGTTPQSDLDMTPIQQSELQNERCPRISAADLLFLAQNDRDQSAIIDIRTSDEYNRGMIPGSLNVVPSEGLESDAPIRAHRGKTVVVVGSKGPAAARFAEYLLRCGYPRVSSLHRGIQVMRSTNILQIPESFR